MANASSLALRAVFARAIATLGFANSPAVITGLTPSVKALAAVAAARAAAGVTLLVVPTDKDVEQATADARFFYRVLQGAGPLEAQEAVLPFPSPQVDPYRGMTPHFRVSASRAAALHAAAHGRARLIVASAPALLPRVAHPSRFLQVSVDIKPGTEIAPLDLAGLLVDAGFSREDPVDEHGSFTVRGGILDVFPAAEQEPIRIEFVGDMVESLRRFDSSTQRSTAAIDRLQIVPVRERFDPVAGADGPDLVDVVDFLAASQHVRVLVSEYQATMELAKTARAQLDASYSDALLRGAVSAPAPDGAYIGADSFERWLVPAQRLEELAIDQPGDDAGSTGRGSAVRHVSSQSARGFHGRVNDWVAEIRQARDRGDLVLFFADSQGRAERTVELLRDYEIVAVPVDDAETSSGAAVVVAVGSLSRGFRVPDAGLQIYAEGDIFDEERRPGERRRDVTRTFLSDLRDLKVGDLVVHIDHGIGEFVGLKQLGVRGTEGAREFLELRYHGDDKLFVPVERLDLVQKYTGGARPALDRLGGTTWEKAKSRVKKAMRDMAQELLKLYAQRRAVPGHAFSPDTHWQQEFEGTFPYDLTPDQASAIEDVKRDMESPTPMDRLLCGDVGYGKTEVAMRAAFKAVMDAKQVAFLAPTTVLAFQHTKTLRERFAGFPVTIEMVSRFRSKEEVKQTLEALAIGKVDVIVGTHRLLSKDVRFKDLGLLVVDEEQRFGVAHKERIKQMRTRVDVLTMTATPIPRTLNMSLVGIRDMSVIETPPKDRLSIQTSVVKFDAPVIQRAIRNELSRGGQVYFVHNRVESIFSMGGLLQRLVPEARVMIGHGQMGEDELERAMLGFVEHKCDVLLATTIVENGLDIPNANTIIINRADRYGLSQLYQLRGRVGRSDRAAFAYLLIPPQDSLTPVARRRLAAIREFSDLGSGFRVAALDLEIRGAGNLLGGQQSGHIEAVGFDMYVKLLEETIRELKGEDLEDDARAQVNLGVDLKIDEGYIADVNQRLVVYRRVAASRTDDELASAVTDVRDRYGPPPASLLNLVEYGRIRIQADRLGIEAIDREGRFVVLRFRPQAKVDPIRLVKVVSSWPGAVLVPPASLKLDLEGETRRQPAAGSGPGGAPRRPGQRQARPAPSWWASRATSGDVAPGFSKEDLQRRTEADPRAHGGMFARLSSLLEALGQVPDR